MKSSSWKVTIHPTVGSYLQGSPSPQDAQCLSSLRDAVAKGRRQLSPMAKSSWVANLYYVDDCNHRVVFYYHRWANILEMQTCDPYP